MNKRINSFIKKSENEFKKYQKTKDLDYLAQAGEKLWNIYNMLIEELIKKKIRSHQQMKGILFKLDDRYLWDTHDKAFNLHKFFYGGYTDNPKDEADLYQDVLVRIKVIKNKVKI